MIHGVDSNVSHISSQQRKGVVYDPWAYQIADKVRINY